MARIGLFTFGCKLNQTETLTIARELKEAGYSIVQGREKMDIAVINSCTVTEDANKECLKLIRSIKHRNPQAIVIVTGCYAQLRPDEVVKKGGADFVLGNYEKKDLVHYLQNLDHYLGNGSRCFVSPIQEIDLFHLAYNTEGKTRFFLKIQDGCDYKCSFCTIPRARGRSRSASLIEIAQALRKLQAENPQEIVLTGINLGDYHWNGYRLSDVVEFILESLPELPRLRLSSVEPNLVDDKLVTLFRTETRLMPHLHLPLQSGSDPILKKMRRRYLTKHYQEVVYRLTEARPDIAIGVDVIVGFPGEKEEDFQATYSFLHSLPVAYFHVFPYSIRPGTPAAQFEEQIPTEVKKERVRRLRLLSQEKQIQFARQFLGTSREVLIDKEKTTPINKESIFIGYTENFLRVQICSTSNLHNQRIKVLLKEVISTAPLILTGHVQESL